MAQGPRSGSSLQRRLLLGVLAAVGLVWLAAASLVWWDARNEVDELLDAHLAQSAALLVAQQAHVSGEGRRDTQADTQADAKPDTQPEDKHDKKHDKKRDRKHDDDHDDDEPADAPLLHRYARHVAFQVWHEGQLVLHSPNLSPTPMSALTDGFDTLVIGGEPWRLFASRGIEADVQVYVAEKVASRGEILKAVLRALLMPALLMLPAVALAVWLAVRSGLRPLRGLSAALRARSPQTLEPVSLPGGAPAELQPLLDALNPLFDRIASLLDNERRFTADAAHELRTPIAAIRTQAQVALGATDNAQRRHALQSTLAGCDRATHLVEQLLTLSRLEAAEVGGAGAPLDLSALARRVVAELAPAALARNQTIEVDAPAAVPIAASEALAGVLLRNLVDNALRYSPEGASVQVSVGRSRQGDGVLSVEDSGAGLPEADMARLGERFFRVPGNEASGSGLGWSIVRRIARVQQAEVELRRSEALGGLAVSVRWPALRA